MQEYECVVGYEQTEIVLEATLSDISGDNFTVTCKMTQARDRNKFYIYNL